MKEFDINRAKLNLTIGVYAISNIEMFKVDDAGVLYPVSKVIKSMLHLITFYGNFNGRLIKAPNGEQFGHYTKGKGYDGVIGQVERGEVDMGWLPISFQIQNPPGKFTPAVIETSYFLHSFPRSSITLNQNVLQSFSFLTPSTWLILLMIVYGLELVISYKNFKSATSYLIDTTILLPKTIFSQHFMDRSLFRWLQLVLITICVSIFNAAFSTSSMVGSGDPKINTLKDIVTYDKTPCFFEGLSVFELFEEKVNKEFAAVYELAERKGTAVAARLGWKSAYLEWTNKVVGVLDDKVGKIGNAVDETDHPEAKFSYWSERPFYRAAQGFIHNPQQNVDQITKRLNSITSKFLQSAIFWYLRTEMSRELVVRTPILKLNRFILYKRTIKKTQLDIKFTPLKIEGLLLATICLFAVFLIAITITLIELLLAKYCEQK